jgi:membrane associated rhomboid family serine protease
MRLKYNAPVVLSFTLVSAVVMTITSLAGPAMLEAFFRVPGRGEGFRFFSLGALRLLTHVIGHADWAHLMSNFTFILLIGPILEEKYGSGPLLFMMIVTAVATGVLNVLLFPTGLLGASGIVFMLILLVSVTNIKAGEIPLTFIVVVLLFLVKEFVGMFQRNAISEFAHIIGGISGAVFGFLFTGDSASQEPAEPVV